MSNDQKIVFFTFAGRAENMAVQRLHIERLLDAYPKSQFHVWDLTRTLEDQVYIKNYVTAEQVGGRNVVYMGQLHTGHPIECLYPDPATPRYKGWAPCNCMLHKPPYEAVYAWYRDQRAYGSGPSDDATFVKFDDDVIWMDTERFGEVLEFLETRPDAIASANVANNAVCAKYEPALVEVLKSDFDIKGIESAFDSLWWALHTRAEFAEESLTWLASVIKGANSEAWVADAEPFRTREGEKVSINFVAMKYPVLCDAARLMNGGQRGGMGDEGAIDSMLPWIVPNFRVAHLSFGPQEKALGPERIAELRNLFTNTEEKS